MDDPSSHPDKFPTKEIQDNERQRLFRLIEKMVLWENATDKELFAKAYEEIKKSTNGNPPPVFDPFAGGGAIPLEAQRLGLKAIAADLNPVAVMINKAMIEIPTKFANQPPVNPEAKSLVDADWQGAQGLANDIAYYGKMLKERAFEKIGHLYPKVDVPETGQEATVIAWIWARTVKCPNPACECKMPLVHSFWLSKKKKKAVYLSPVVDGKKVRFEIRNDTKNVPEGTVNRTGARCVSCGANVPFSYIREEAKAGRMGTYMMAVVAEGINGRLYLEANEEYEKIATIDRPNDYPDAVLPNNPRDFKTPNYGLNNFADLFTNRQLTALTTFSDLITDMHEQVCKDGGSKEYGEAITLYLAFAVDKALDWNSSICGWNPSRDVLRNTFGRQAIPMVWDYAEANIFSESAGSFESMLKWIKKCTQSLPTGVIGDVIHHDASQDNGLKEVVISTDPPYYDNISYANLSDYFYIWLRRILRSIYPEIFSIMQTPKQMELIAEPSVSAY